MTITIKGKEYELAFGMKFIRELDKKYFIDAQGIRFGAGLDTIAIGLLTGNPAALADVLYVATCTLKSRPTPTEIDEYVEEAEDLDVLFDEVNSELKNSKITAKKWSDLTGEIDKMQNQ